eukprot:GEZU01019437.1.p1 GENE.GEZU01019437.1~~GEZU01019437.1.p1  ORF type:complete len:476 (-),score=80.38 GEZU01019437.1:142-1443(-)
MMIVMKAIGEMVSAANQHNQAILKQNRPPKQSKLARLRRTISAPAPQTTQHQQLSAAPLPPPAPVPEFVMAFSKEFQKYFIKDSAKRRTQMFFSSAGTRYFLWTGVLFIIVLGVTSGGLLLAAGAVAGGALAAGVGVTGLLKYMVLKQKAKRTLKSLNKKKKKDAKRQQEQHLQRSESVSMSSEATPPNSSAATGEVPTGVELTDEEVRSHAHMIKFLLDPTGKWIIIECAPSTMRTANGNNMVSENEYGLTKSASLSLLAYYDDKGEDDGIEVPPEFLCPITHDIMRDPVITVDGHVYDRMAIARWFATHSPPTSPLTNQKLESTQLIPNTKLKQQIEQFVKWRAEERQARKARAAASASTSASTSLSTTPPPNVSSSTPMSSTTASSSRGPVMHAAPSAPPDAYPSSAYYYNHGSMNHYQPRHYPEVSYAI